MDLLPEGHNVVLGRPNIGTILINRGLISEDQLKDGLKRQTSSGCRLGQALVDLGFCSERDIALSLADQLEVPFIDLEEFPPAAECLLMLAREVALEYGVLPIRMEGDRLLVGARDPFDIHIDEVVRQYTGKKVLLAISPESQLRDYLIRCYPDDACDAAPLNSAQSREDVELGEAQQMRVERLAASGEETSTVRAVNALVCDAIRRGATDLHIEPGASGLRVRYRVDGRLQTVVSMSLVMLQSVVARLKIMSGIDISENRKPQDGGAQVKVDGQPYELRVSTLPGIYGEVVVIRIMNTQGGLPDLGALGFEPDMERDLRRLLSASQGMILVTGPTGSGKSTTLYSALACLNTEDVNIITVEDPVEMRLPGINQVQVNDRAGRSFATTLRAMLRQDPDVIMVGEIRDGETAEIACQAALTGHLVLSTLHTQDTLGTLTRLLDMEVPGYIVTSALNAALAQRLVRRVCPACVQDYDPPPALKLAFRRQFGSLEGARFRKGRGCPICHRTGTRGRVGVYELLIVDDQVRRLLVEGASSDAVREFVSRRGFRSMEEDAFRKACQGLIAPEEVVSLGMGLVMHMDDSPEALPAGTPGSS